MGRLKEHRSVLLAGALMGALGSLLAYLGNPANTGICISCFLENAAGALGLHANARMQYLRPELLGFLLGSFAMAAVSREFRPRWRASGFAMLGFGFLMALGSAIFIGCPIKALLRLAAGDLTALPGFAGLGAGIWLGIRLLDAAEPSVLGGEDGRTREAPLLLPLGVVIATAVLAGLAFVPGALFESRSGGGAVHASPVWSLGAGLALGASSQRSRFCVTGSLRDLMLTRSLWPAAGLLLALAAAIATNVATGQFRLGYADQPGSHLEWAWGLLGMGLVGVVAVLAGGCPFRQIIRAGEGDLDAATATAGMLAGAALVQSWGLGGSSAGVPAAGKMVILLGLAAVLGYDPIVERLTTN
ncbi:MAG: YedE-related selenium metabolism membrane protein [Deltaproteobacteria bacterium]|nr:YedE-related selenium metabolism membrane protein [Deltaproteobacteria bacterium]